MLQEIISSLTPAQIQERFSIDYYLGDNPTMWTYFFDNYELGEAFFQFIPEKNEISWYKFDPLSTTAAQRLGKGIQRASNVPSYGLGTLAHTITLLTVYDNIPSLAQGTISHVGDTSEGRIAHLLKMNIDYRKTYPFMLYLKNSINYAERKGFLFPEKPF